MDSKHAQGRRGFLASSAALIAGTAGAQPAPAPAPAATAPGPQRRIDVHAHFLPEKYRSALAAAGHAKPSGMPGIPKWSVEQHIEMMDRNDIASSVLSISAPGLHFGDDAAARGLARHVNEEGAKAMQAHPKRFGLFASLPLPDVDGALKEIDHAFDVLKADGVALESNFHGVYLGDRRLEPVFAELNRRNAKVFIHPTNPHCPCCQVQPKGEDAASLPPIGYPYPMIEFMFETTRAVFNLILSGTLTRNPNLQVIVPHAGATLPVLADRVAGIAPALGLAEKLDPKHVFDLLRGMHYDLAGFPLPRQLKALLEIADPQRILYGSDYPFTPEPLVAALAAQLDGSPQISNQLRQDFMRNNALALFPKFA
ncbi:MULTISPECIES: amidohydrolase family protein [unclassified Variovorax]|uniref:amidohydrolase family protein n=1 Tax=unclassified Variovorax TaxID=663243 RepID=UPI001BD64208|nr:MULTISPECIES: amidohydrolase family protein [unclassified Variovorax]